jgi:hypothetical protein
MLLMPQKQAVKPYLIPGQNTVGWRMQGKYLYLISSIILYNPLKNPFKFLLLILFVSGCKEPNKQEEKEMIFQTKTADGMVVSRFYPNQVPKDIYQINDQGRKEGFSFYYNKDGALRTITFWKNGIKNGEEISFDPLGGIKEKTSYTNGLREGNSLRYKNGILTSHQINREGKTWYTGMYSGPEKYLNKLYPHFIEEFFFEDKYYAKIRFPLDHAGQMTVRVKDWGTPVIEQLDNATFQLVINDALDLDGFVLDLEYQPAPSDTLVHSRYLYKHDIYQIN